MLKLLWGQPNDYLLVQLNFMTCKASVQIFLIICELCKRQAMQGSVGNLSSLATSQVFGGNYGVIVLRLAHHVTGGVLRQPALPVPWNSQDFSPRQWDLSPPEEVFIFPSKDAARRRPVETTDYINLASGQTWRAEINIIWHWTHLVTLPSQELGWET